ncbi:DUF4296 domain-containing protein [Flavobacterium sp.]|uniref:DUF4296 domain-containing protein n=1 Tax=Flavobacterium sp. TaxID=239 RepID=UPI0039E6D9DF
MKRVAFLLGLMVLLASCKDQVVEKPEKLLDEGTMANVLYDLAVIEAMKSRDQGLTGNSTPQYVYKKYGIDSLQFVQNNQYYAAEIAKYKKIYDKVNERLENERKVADSLARKNGETAAPSSASAGNTPQIQ